MTQTVLSVDNLRKTFYHVPHFITAVHRVSFTVNPSESVGLLGLNGAGKTTTVKMILNFLTPDEGTAEIFGTDSRQSLSRERISYLPEKISLPVELKPRELFQFLGRTFSITRSEIQTRQNELMSLVRLSGKEEVPLGKFSKGMIQRLGIALTLFHHPEFIILDEPLTGLDPLGIRMMEEIIQSKRREGLTMLICSHNLDFVERVCDRVVIIHEGSVRGELALRNIDRPLREKFFEVLGL